MKQKKIFSIAVTFLLIAFLTTSWVSSTQAQKPTEVSITVPFKFTSGAFPNFTFDGPFTISGAIEASGNARMDASLNANGMVYHCTWTLTDASGGTITLHEQCEMGSNPVKGRWEIVSGTGKYENIRGNGSALMPDVGDPNIYQENLTGKIFSK